MTTLSISSLDRADIVRLATENGKKLTLTPLGDYKKFISGVEVTAHCWVVDSISGERMRFHDIQIWQLGQTWYGECDSLEDCPEEDKACKANRLGGRLCSHLSRCLMELENGNKIKLSFIGKCQTCCRDKVRVAFDGIDYSCIDQAACQVAKDKTDVFGT